MIRRKNKDLETYRRKSIPMRETWGAGKSIFRKYKYPADGTRVVCGRVFYIRNSLGKEETQKIGQRIEAS